MSNHLRGAVSALPLFSDPVAPPAMADAFLPMVVGGEAVELHASRALYWPRERALFVADVHLGKGAALRAGGIALPRGSTAADLARLSALIERCDARSLVILGDFLHAASGRVPALDAAFCAFRRRHAQIAVLLVRGNHDAHAGDPPPQWQVEVVGEPHAMAPFIACHHPVRPKSGYALCGHIHPGVSISGVAEPSLRLPCFVVGRRRAILPAFGRLTGFAPMAFETDDCVVAIAGQRLVRLAVRR